MATPLYSQGDAMLGHKYNYLVSSAVLFLRCAVMVSTAVHRLSHELPLLFPRAIVGIKLQDNDYLQAGSD